MRVLIAEDDPIVSMMMEDVLLDDGHKVVGPVATAKAALHLMERLLPDLLLVDINLADGESGCDLVREAHERWGTPALFVTGSPEKAELCDNAIGVLVKPFPHQSLTAAIDIAGEMMDGRVPGIIPPELRLFPSFILGAERRAWKADRFVLGR